MKTNKETIKEIEDVGVVLLKQSKNCKAITIRLKPFSMIEVTYPKNYSIKKVINFVKSKSNWVKKKMIEIKNRESKLTVFDEDSNNSFIEELRKNAKKILPDRTMQLADIHGFMCRKIFLKNMKSRWGSCSLINNINLNIHLMRLPDYLIDYIILHELCHTVEKNHSQNFWNLLNKCTENKAKMFAKELRNYCTRIY